MVRNLGHQSYYEPVDIHLVNSEIMLSNNNGQLIEYPIIFWRARNANFVVIRMSIDQFPCQFFYTLDDQCGQGQEEHDSLEECVATVSRSRPITTKNKHRPARNAIADWASVYVSTKFNITNRASPTWNNRKTFFMHSLAV